MAPLQHITTKNTTHDSGYSLGHHKVASEEVEFVVVPSAKPLFRVDAFEISDLVVAFWWVQTTSDKRAANMAIDYIKQCGVDIPVMKNSVALDPGTKLRIWAKPKPQPFPIFSGGSQQAKKHRKA